MRLHCNSCRTDFTTLRAKSGEKFSFSHLVMDKMECPNCGARNSSRLFKPLRHTRDRYQPRGRLTDTDDADSLPKIVLAEECQHRIYGTLYSPEGLQVDCDGCPSFFNCYTGNVDDGVKIEVVAKTKEELETEAKEKVAKRARFDLAVKLQNERERLSKFGFGYLQGGTQAKFRGTIWKLSDKDIQAILNGGFLTEKASVIRHTLTNRGVSLDAARSLLRIEPQASGHPIDN